MTSADGNKRLRRILAEGYGATVRPEIDRDAVPHADDLLSRVDVAVRTAHPDSSRRDVSLALDQLSRHGERALERLRQGSRETLSADETFALEAIVRLDGSRPSLLLRNGRCPENHPLVGRWARLLAAHSNSLAAAANATGRIQPDDGSETSYFGTGFLIDARKGLVLTNRHVLDAILQHPKANRRWEGGSYRFTAGVAIDFAGEFQSLEPHRSRVVEGRPARVSGSGFQLLDIAVLRVEPCNGRALPEPVKLELNLDAALGADLSPICLFGFAGRPQFDPHVGTEADWEWIDSTLMDGVYGFKRLAPGYVHIGLGAEAHDPEKWVFGHDASTLGGSSGAPVISFRRSQCAFAIHFAGRARESNYAHAITDRVATELRSLGVDLD